MSLTFVNNSLLKVEPELLKYQNLLSIKVNYSKLLKSLDRRKYSFTISEVRFYLSGFQILISIFLNEHMVLAGPTHSKLRTP